MPVGMPLAAFVCGLTLSLLMQGCAWTRPGGDAVEDPDELVPVGLATFAYDYGQSDSSGFFPKGMGLADVVHLLITGDRSFVAKHSIWTKRITCAIPRRLPNDEMLIEVLAQNDLCVCEEGHFFYRIMPVKEARESGRTPLRKLGLRPQMGELPEDLPNWRTFEAPR